MIHQSILVWRAALHRVRLYHRPALSSTSPHDMSDSIDMLQSNRVSSSKNSDSSRRVPENTDFTLRGSGMHQQIHVGNFMKMLRYQDTASHEPPNENFSRKVRVSDSTPRRGLMSNQDGDAASPSPTTHLKANPELRRKQSQAVASERPSWRNRQKVKLPETHVAPKKQNNVATSEWIQVSSTPPMSKLSDLLPSLNQILEFEQQKGIIDLNVLESLKHNSSARSVFRSLDELDGSNSLYTTEVISDGRTAIPLWTPTSSDNSQHSYMLDACPMIQEARIQLSICAHPVGWFLRLPCRSVVNAVLNHVCLANNQLLNSVQISSLKHERKKWREGLWKGVYAEYESCAEVKDMQLALENDHLDEKEMMWGYGNLEQDEECSLLESAAVRESDPGTAYDQNNEGKRYLQSYIQKHPFPSQLLRLSSYRPLKSGSKIVSVREFTPLMSEFTDEKHIPWDQCAFYLSPLLNISDSVIRLETSDLYLSEEDIQQIFRGYDLKSIPEIIESATLPYGFDAFIRALGWNIASGSNVDMTAKGNYEPNENISMRGRTKKMTRREKTNTFLVRFASPSEARMAIRDINRNLREYGDRLHVTAFPSSDLGEI